MLRRLLNLFSLLCFLILLAIPVLWVHSRSHRDQFTHDTLTSSRGIYSVGGRCGYHFEDHGDKIPGWHLQSIHLPPDPSFNHWSYLEIASTPNEYRVDFLGINYFHLQGRAEGQLLQLLIPYPYYALLAAIFPTLFLRRTLRLRRQRYRQTHNLCPNCAYDLRTHLTGQAGPNCPLCGTPITPTAPH